ncbi:MAG: TonB-dependent receptor [Planctomycetota bacterium]
MFKRSSIPLIILFLIGGMALPQETPHQESENKTKLKEVIVTAPRLKNQADDIPSSITIINNEDIRNSPFEKVEDILRTTTGVNVNYHYAINIVSGNRPVNLRGTGGYGERTLVLVDGIPQNNAYNGWVEWSQIPKESIERIEIMRGPASALYGSNAMGGVINIITKKPEKKTETILKQNYGSMNSSLTKLIQDGKLGNFRYYLNGEYENTDGYIGTKPRQVYDTERYRTEKRLFSRFIYEPDEHNTVTAGFSRYDADKGGGRKYMYGYTKNNRSWLDWLSDNKKIDWHASFRISDDRWTNFYDKSPYNYLYRREVVPIFGTGGSAESTINLLEKYTLIAGIDYNHNSIETKNKYYTVVRSSATQGKQTLLAPFINNEIRFSDDKFIVNFGGRYDWIKSYDGENHDTLPTPLPPYDNDFSSNKWREFSPKLGLVYHADKNTTLKTSVAKGFKAPSLFELYTTYSRGALLIEANPDLQPEKIISYDSGIERKFLDNLSAKLTIYQAYARNFIGYNTITATDWKTDNIAKVKMQGIETELNLQINTEWSGLINYTNNESQIMKYTADPTIEDNYLAYTPKNVGKLGITYNKPEILEFQTLINYNGLYYDSNQNTSEFDPYYTVNINLARQFGKNSRLSIGVENVFDKEYIIYKGTSQDIESPGRVFNLMLNINF